MERNRIGQTTQTLLYIGTHSDQNNIPVNFRTSLACDYSHARNLVRSALTKAEDLPTLIVINLPLVTPGLKGFVSFLKKRLWTKAIPLIYNEGALTDDQQYELSDMQLVDDIMDIKLFANELEQKAVFLQKAKRILNDPKRLTVNDITSRLKKKDIYDVNFIVRRLLDIIIASAILLVLSPLFILVMIVIKLESKGPVIYKSKRAGRGCKIFNFYKFRTMFDGAENSVEAMVNLYGNENQCPRFFKAVNDPRITKVGSFLRNTSLDELPQLVNVIKGDMSLVGNRPLPIYEASTLTTDAWAERFMAPAGITGLWQVLKRGREDVSIKERLDLDINYARHNNIGRDLWILANTPKALFQKVNV